MESLWIAEEKEILEKSKRLEEEIETEVCIIGGGITGISTAYELSKQGKKVVIIERDKLAEKTTGNTTAKITSQHGLFYDYLIEDYGINFAKKYYMANEEAIKNIEVIVKEENIDCDLEKQDAYVFTEDAKEIEKIEKEVKAVNAIGGKAELVQKIEPKLENVQGAVKFPNQAQFNPRKYLKGLIKKIIENGGEIYEESIAEKVKRTDEGYIVYTDKGTVKAKYIVIATHYPIINVPGFYFLKMYQEASYAIAIETEESKFSGMYIKKEEPIISLRTAKMEDKQVIILGGMGHRVGAKIDLKDAFVDLEKIAKEMYPDSKVLYKWGTQDCVTLDKIPYIGEYSKIMENIYVATRLQKMGNDNIKCSCKNHNRQNYAENKINMKKYFQPLD